MIPLDETSSDPVTWKSRKVGRKPAASMTDLVFNTPIVRLNRVVPRSSADVYVKLESFSPGGSVKDRIALNMIMRAEEEGRIQPGSVIVEPTSGNTGIGIAFVCAVRGYRCIITMSESMSLERIFILKSYGAEVVLTPAREGMEGAVRRAEEIVRKTPAAVMLQQFNNPSNPDVHRKSTALEILEAMEEIGIDAFVTSVGTGGTITGVGEVLKQRHPATLVVGVEPEASPVLSGGKPGPHKIQGIGAGFVPQVLNREVLDRIELVSDNDAYRMAQRLCREEGIFCGISSGANVVAALRVAAQLGEGKSVVSVICDTGERYFSTQQYYEV